MVAASCATAPHPAPTATLPDLSTDAPGIAQLPAPVAGGGGWPRAVLCARRLVLAYGWNATAYQLVNPGLTLWFDTEPPEAAGAVVGYVRHAGMRVVAGAPVCAPESLAETVAAFERDAAKSGERVCYFGAEDRLEALLGGSAVHSRLQLGAQPVWRPERLAETLVGYASLRAQLNRARNKGVGVEEVREPDDAVLAGMRRVLAEWLSSRGLPTLHFLVEPETLGRLADRRVFVARRGGKVVGFLVLSPIPARDGWLTEQFVRGRGAPNGTVELMLAAAARAAADEVAAYITLGLAPLSRRAGADDGSPPLWLRATLALTRAHGRRFYDFGGLDAFKAKFRPERWDPVFAISQGARFPVRSLYAIAGAFGGRSPLTLLPAAVGRAALQELRWARERWRSADAGAAGGGADAGGPVNRRD